MDALTSVAATPHAPFWPYGGGWTRMPDRLARNGSPFLLRRNFFPFHHQPPPAAQRIDLFLSLWLTSIYLAMNRGILDFAIC